VDSCGILQTDSRLYGKALEQCPLPIPADGHEARIVEVLDNRSRPVVIAGIRLAAADMTLVIVKPKTVALQSWYALKSQLVIVFLVGALLIGLSVVTITEIMVRRIREADDNREKVLCELQHSQKLSSIGRLAAGVAHEINNPLAIINEKAGLMNDIIDCSGECKGRERFQALTASILQSVDRCRTITHRLLGFATRIDIQEEEMDLNTVAADMMGFLDQEARFRGIGIRLDLADPLNRVRSDRGQIQQVLLNLLTNAMAAVDDNGSITITTKNLGDGGVEISVDDNGCGIPEAVMDHIFEPFFSTGKQKGTGLGLSITYGIVQKLGGTIRVTSREAEGTHVAITLPSNPDQNQGSG
jgi:two-component system NtrC family sensor kinase